MNVDKSWRDIGAFRVYYRRCAASDFTNRCDSIAFYRNIRLVGFVAGAIDHDAVLDEDIVIHSGFPLVNAGLLIGSMKLND
jgi:hypothetical protein